MSDFDSDEVNPYQPPKSDVSRLQSPRPKRPVVWWLALMVFVLGALSWSLRQWFFWQEFGQHSMGWNGPTALSLGCYMAAFVLMIGGRSHWSHRIVTCFMVILMVGSLLPLLTEPDLAQRVGPGVGIAALVVQVVKIWIFGGFIFGFPSRRYYGLASKSEAAEA
ncbi:hypothetical protein SAMN02745166_00980 [Prosthecobacter debontii]|uniref:Uncharacterized protein n=1 Tax=Prosthecobacter debontii TaxID=48467 RepID=A0A1T4X383_9BACT|nr:hypothetical protein [Prosthecobacter debontii]SKA84074.1 hypothetical protein SAMN02745166_00980 [Prosthecobacter debontii]